MGIDIGLDFAVIPYLIYSRAFQSDIRSFRYRTELRYQISDWLIWYKFSWYIGLVRYTIFMHNNKQVPYLPREIFGISQLMYAAEYVIIYMLIFQILDIARTDSLSEIILTDWLPFGPVSERSDLGLIPISECADCGLSAQLWEIIPGSQEQIRRNVDEIKLKVHLVSAKFRRINFCFRHFVRWNFVSANISFRGNPKRCMRQTTVRAGLFPFPESCGKGTVSGNWNWPEHFKMSRSEIPMIDGRCRQRQLLLSDW